MTRDEIRDRFRNIGVWQRGDERAPYKPLLLLYALARCRARGERLIPFSEVDERLRPIFRTFGPSRRTYHTEYPFWYLKNDGIWEVSAGNGLVLRRGKASQPTKTSLLQADAAGGFEPAVFKALASDPQLLRDVVSDLLTAQFPESMHEEILNAVGLEITVERAVRDAQFRHKVLLAYEYRCAVCGFDARLIDALVGVEAAHIKWHQAGGPASVPNGIAMCSLHHKLFDRGAFTLTDDRRAIVSQQLNGGDATRQAVIGFHERPLAIPEDPALRPRQEFIDWHRAEVFRTPGRWLANSN